MVIFDKTVSLALALLNKISAKIIDKLIKKHHMTEAKKHSVCFPSLSFKFCIKVNTESYCFIFSLPIEILHLSKLGR